MIDAEQEHRRHQRGQHAADDCRHVGGELAAQQQPLDDDRAIQRDPPNDGREQQERAAQPHAVERAEGAQVASEHEPHAFAEHQEPNAGERAALERLGQLARERESRDRPAAKQRREIVHDDGPGTSDEARAHHDRRVREYPSLVVGAKRERRAVAVGHAAQ